MFGLQQCTDTAFRCVSKRTSRSTVTTNNSKGKHNRSSYAKAHIYHHKTGTIGAFETATVEHATFKIKNCTRKHMNKA